MRRGSSTTSPIDAPASPFCNVRECCLLRENLQNNRILCDECGGDPCTRAILAYDYNNDVRDQFWSSVIDINPITYIVYGIWGDPPKKNRLKKIRNPINHEFRIFSRDGSANPIARPRAGRERRGGEKEGTGSKGGQTRADSEVARPVLGNIPSDGGQGDEKPVWGRYDSDAGEERGRNQGLGVQQDGPGNAADTSEKVAPAQD
ncbi:unnamed protein product [Mytilus coruscus]|uniref:Uncharacterized protein n=1 Tax=Mytilus coruscus TaxID=42192 RepID=A0A6J8D004_MYTCO|nr:unnamed protein product [Mytilus coruscus]